MKPKVEKMDVWVAHIKDRRGQLAQLLRSLADAGENLEFVLGRRDRRGSGVAYLAPISNKRRASSLGLSKSTDVFAVRVSASNRRGLGAEILEMIADVGINLRGVSAHGSKRTSTAWLSFDSKADASKAAMELRLELSVSKSTRTALPKPSDDLAF